MPSPPQTRLTLQLDKKSDSSTPTQSEGITPSRQPNASTARDASSSADFKSELDELKTLLKRGVFHEDSLERAKRLESLLPTQGDQLLSLKAQSIISEVRDYFGEDEPSQRVVRDGAELFKQLDAVTTLRLWDGSNNSERERNIVREQVRLCLNYAHVCLYRLQDYKAADKIVEQCLGFVEQRLSREKVFPCFGTLAQAHFYRARILRQLNRLDAAEKHFTEAIGYYYKRAKWRQTTSFESTVGNEEHGTLLASEFTFASYRSALCLLGLGWVNHRKGLLTRALQCLLPARVLLLQTEDSINKACLDLILASIKRSLAGKDRHLLVECARLMEEAHRTFRSHHHEPYKLWATWETCLLYFQQGEFAKARQTATRVLAIAKRRDDYRSECNANILMSRLDCAISMGASGHGRTATLSETVKSLESTIEFARQRDQWLCHTEGLIALGETQIQAGNPIARGIFLRVLQASGRGSPGIAGVCYLNLARYCARRNLGGEARAWLAKWRRLSTLVEEKLVHDLAAAVVEEVGKTNSFFVDWRARDLMYVDLEKNLRTFLISVSHERGGSTREQAARMGIKESTLRKWRQDLGLSG